MDYIKETKTVEGWHVLCWAGAVKDNVGADAVRWGIVLICALVLAISVTVMNG